MSTELVVTTTVTAEDLLQKQEELLTLEADLAQRELELLTFRTELLQFQAHYLKIVGPLYAELDRLEAEIAEFKADSNPEDSRARRQAESARARARESAEAASEGETESEIKFKPSENLKKLYRDFAKRFHPDLAADRGDRKRLEKLMADANQAYATGDESLLQQLLEQGEKSPEAVRGYGTEAELERVIRKIGLVKERLQAIKIEMAELKGSSLCQLKRRADEAAEHGLDLLREMAGFLNREIGKALNRMTRLKADKSSKPGGNLVF